MIQPPAAVSKALLEGATLAVSISGGKDGQAALALQSEQRKARQWPGKLLALHADLGRFEWPETTKAVLDQATRYGAELQIVRRGKGDLLDRITHEADRLAGTGRAIWPSAAARYCTSDLKRDPLVRAQRHLGSGIIIAVQGLRAEESSARAKRAVLSIEKRATSQRLAKMNPVAAVDALKDGERLVLNWLAVHHLSIDQVWKACGTSQQDLERRRADHAQGTQTSMDEALAGWPCHPAYVYGITRVSCAICVIASAHDIAIGARRNPDLARQITAIEKRTNQSFRPERTLADIIKTQDAAADPTEANKKEIAA